MSSDLPGDPPQPGMAEPASQPDPMPPPVAETVPPTADPATGMAASDPATVLADIPQHADDPELAAAPAHVEMPPPEMVATGKVIEARETVIIIRTGIVPGESAWPVNPGHDAMPGHAITIYADGTVQIGNYTAPEPSIAVPSVPRIE